MTISRSRSCFPLVRALGDRHSLTTRQLSTGPSPLKLLFLGGDAFSVGVLEPILGAREEGLWSDLLVVTSGEKQVGRGSKGTRRVVRELRNRVCQKLMCRLTSLRISSCFAFVRDGARARFGYNPIGRIQVLAGKTWLP